MVARAGLRVPRRLRFIAAVLVVMLFATGVSWIIPAAASDERSISVASAGVHAPREIGVRGAQKADGGVQGAGGDAQASAQTAAQAGVRDATHSEKVVLPVGHIDSPKVYWGENGFELKANAGELYNLQDTISWLRPNVYSRGEQYYGFTVGEHSPALDFLGKGSTWWAAPSNCTSCGQIWQGYGADTAIPYEQFRDGAGVSAADADGTFWLNLLSMEGPGRLEMIRGGQFDDEQWGTFRRIISSDGVGMRSAALKPGTHTHIWTLFSAPGDYRLVWQVSARKNDGSIITSEPTVQNWRVGGSEPESTAMPVLGERFAAAPQGSTAGYSFSVETARSHEAQAHGISLASWTFSAPKNVAGQAQIYINGYPMSTVEVSAGKGVFTQLPAVGTASYQVVFFPQSAEHGARWVSEPVSYTSGGSAVSTQKTGLLPIPDPSLVVPTLDLGDVSAPRDARATVTLSPGAFDTTFSASVQLSDPHIRGDVILDFFEPGTASEYPEVSYAGTLVNGRWSNQIEDLDGTAGLDVRFTFLPHSSMRHLHKQTATVCADFDPAQTSSVTVPLDAPASEDAEESAVRPDEHSTTPGATSDVPASPSESDLPQEENPNAEHPDAGQSGAEQPGAEDANADAPDPDKPNRDKPTLDKPALDGGGVHSLEKRVLLDAGHVDLAAHIIDGDLDMRIKDDTGLVDKKSTLRLPHTVALGVRNHAREVNTAKRIKQGYGFLGAEGTAAYILPQTEKSGLIWPGYSTEALAGKVDFSSLQLHIALLDGAGDVKLYQADFGKPTVLFDSAHSDEATIAVPAPVHVHTGWAFTQPGHYEVLMYVTGKDLDGAELSSIERSMVFLVGDEAIAQAADLVGTAGQDPRPNPGTGSQPDSGVTPDSEPDGTLAVTPTSGIEGSAGVTPDPETGSNSEPSSASETDLTPGAVPVTPIAGSTATPTSNGESGTESVSGSDSGSGTDSGFGTNFGSGSDSSSSLGADSDSDPELRPSTHITLDHGHADVFNVSMEQGALKLNVKEDATGQHVAHAPEDVALVVKPRALMDLPAGYPAAPKAYVLPLNQDQELLWPGWSTLETQKSSLRSVDIEITRVDGPGQVHVFSQDFLGNPQPLLSGGGTALPGVINVPAPAHVHAYWAFTKAGKYTMSVRVRAKQGEATVVSDTHTYTWIVQPAPGQSEGEQSSGGTQGEQGSGSTSSQQPSQQPGASGGSQTSGGSQSEGKPGSKQEVGSSGSASGVSKPGVTPEPKPSAKPGTKPATKPSANPTTKPTHPSQPASRPGTATPSKGSTAPQAQSHSRPDSPAQQAAGVVALAQGHADAFFLNPTASGLDLVVREDVTGQSVLRKPEDVRFLVGDNAKMVVPAGLPQAGKQAWVLPIVQNPQLLWPGWSSERVKGSADFTVDVSGPGKVYVFTTGLGGKATSVLRGGGLALPGTIHVPSPAHVHANWIFSAPGVYTFQVRGSADGRSTRTATYTFAVGNAAAHKSAPGVRLAGGAGVAGATGTGAGAGTGVAAMLAGVGGAAQGVAHGKNSGAVPLNTKPVGRGICAAAGYASGLPSSLAQDGHFDLGPQLRDGKLVAMIRDDRTQPAQWRNAGDIVFGLGAQAATKVPQELSFLAKVGSPMWMISSVQQPGVPWLGETSQHESIISGTTGEVTTTITGIQGPGQVAHFLPTALGAGVGTILFSITQGPKSYVIPANTHMHGVWVFTAPGEYVISYQHQVTDKAGQKLTADGKLTVVVSSCDVAAHTAVAHASGEASGSAGEPNMELSQAGLAADQGRNFDASWWIQTTLLAAVLLTNMIVLIRWSQRRRSAVSNTQR